MKREDVEQAAINFDLPGGLNFEELLVAFAIRQIDAALEEAAQVIGGEFGVVELMDKIRALKIGAGE